MSESAPSESSAIEATFVVGTDVVEFDRRELPIYLTPESRWAEACQDGTAYGAPLDRLFGEPGVVFVDGVVGPADGQFAAMFGADPLVTLADLTDGAILPDSEEPSPEIGAIFDFGADSHAVVHLHDGWSWDSAGSMWLYDHHA